MSGLAPTDDDNDLHPSEDERFEETVADDCRGQRLDAWLASTFDDFSRSRLAKLIADGQVLVASLPGDPPTPAKANLKLKGGEWVQLTVPPPAPTTLIPEDIPLTLLYDDENLCVVDKPAGLVVHPGAGNESGTLANALLFRYPTLHVGGERRPGIVHRLDKDTSGLIVVAKNDDTLRALAAQFAGRTVDKQYIAVVWGRPGYKGHEGEYLTGHRRAERDRRRYTTRLPPPDPDATRIEYGVRTAHTEYVVRAVAGGLAVVDVTLHTGRTHQIRAHFADAGHPLAQDDLYGGGDIHKRLPTTVVREAVLHLKRQALHAQTLSFDHPKTGKRLRFTSPMPADLQAVIDAIEALEASSAGDP